MAEQLMCNSVRIQYVIMHHDLIINHALCEKSEKTQKKFFFFSLELFELLMISTIKQVKAEMCNA
jgi:hypothetical protein